MKRPMRLLLLLVAAALVALLLIGLACEALQGEPVETTLFEATDEVIRSGDWRSAEGERR